MPRYDYECDNGHRTEHHTTFANAELPAVCHCGARATRVFTPPTNVSVDFKFNSHNLRSPHIRRD